MEFSEAHFQQLSRVEASPVAQSLAHFSELISRSSVTSLGTNKIFKNLYLSFVPFQSAVFVFQLGTGNIQRTLLEEAIRLKHYVISMDRKIDKLTTKLGKSSL